MPLPNHSFKPGNVIRGLPGDVRILAADQAAMLIDVEYGIPQPLLVLVKVTNNLSGATVFASITIQTGVHRASLETEVTNSPGIQRAMVARSVTVHVANTQAAGVPIRVEAIVVPLDITADASIFGSSDFGNDLIADPGTGTPLYLINQFATSVVSQDIGSIQRGIAVQNISPAGRNAYLRLSNPIGAASVLGAHTVRIPPNGFYESPPDWAGAFASIIWDGADAAGFANVTTRVS